MHALKPSCGALRFVAHVAQGLHGPYHHQQQAARVPPIATGLSASCCVAPVHKAQPHPSPWAADHLLLLPVLLQAPTEPLLQAEVGEAPARACAFKPGQRRNAGGKDAIASPDKQSIAASLATLVLTLPALRECRQNCKEFALFTWHSQRHLQCCADVQSAVYKAADESCLTCSEVHAGHECSCPASCTFVPCLLQWAPAAGPCSWWVKPACAGHVHAAAAPAACAHSPDCHTITFDAACCLSSQLSASVS